MLQTLPNIVTEDVELLQNTIIKFIIQSPRWSVSFIPAVSDRDETQLM